MKFSSNCCSAKFEASKALILATACVPARELGGDFYDVLPCGSGGLALALGDVCGKGTGAALLGALLMGILRAHTVDHAASAPEVLAAINDRVHAAHLSGRFVAMLSLCGTRARGN